MFQFKKNIGLRFNDLDMRIIKRNYEIEVLYQMNYDINFNLVYLNIVLRRIFFMLIFVCTNN